MRIICALSLGLAFGAFASGDALAAENCSLQIVRTLEMSELPSGRMTVPMTLNGQQANMLLDTGGGIRALTARTVDHLGLRRFDGNVRMFNLKGHGSIQQVRVADVEFAGIKAKDMVFSVMAGFGDKEEEAQANAQGTHSPGIEMDRMGEDAMDGLIAPELFWDKLDLELDFAAKRMLLISNAHCKGQVVHWPAQVVAVVPYRLDGNQMTFEVELDGKKVRAILDTGAHVNALGLDTARYVLGENFTDGQLAAMKDEHANYYRKQFNTLSFDGITVNKPVIALLPNAMPLSDRTGSHIRLQLSDGPPMLIGMPILKKLHIFIAFKEHMLYITPGAVNAPDSNKGGLPPPGAVSAPSNAQPTPTETATQMPAAESGN